jgi:hypothetical protein
MPAAYTLYKFKKLFGLIFFIFIALILFSTIRPVKEKLISETVSVIDTSGTTSKAVNTYNSIPDPEADAKEASGNFLLKLLNKNSTDFFILIFIVAVILFICGIYLKDVRAFLNRILKF